jgi:hypothetical protein
MYVTPINLNAESEFLNQCWNKYVKGIRTAPKQIKMAKNRKNWLV